MNTTLFESFPGVVAKARDRKILPTFCLVVVERSLESVLKIVDHDLLNMSVDSISALLEIHLVGEKIMKQSAEPLIQVTRSVKATYTPSVTRTSRTIFGSYRPAEPPLESVAMGLPY